MTENLKVRALELAHGDGTRPHADVIARANVYHGWLAGTAAPAGASSTATAPATTAPATTAASAGKAKPATGSKGGKGAAAAPPAGKRSEEEIREIVRKVAVTKGKKEALDLLDSAASVQNVSGLKPAQYEAVYNAFAAALNEGGEGEGEGEGEEPEGDDPLA